MATMTPPSPSSGDYEKPTKDEIDTVKLFGLSDYQIELRASLNYWEFGPSEEILEQPMEIHVVAAHATGFDDDYFTLPFGALLDELVEATGAYDLKGPVISQESVDTVVRIVEREIASFRERMAGSVVPAEKLRHDNWEWEGAPARPPSQIGE